MSSIAIKSTDMDIVFSLPQHLLLPYHKMRFMSTPWQWTLICLLTSHCKQCHSINNTQSKKIKCKGFLPTNTTWCAPPPTFYTTSNLKNQHQAGLLPCHLRPHFHCYKTKRNLLHNVHAWTSVARASNAYLEEKGDGCLLVGVNWTDSPLGPGSTSPPTAPQDSGIRAGGEPVSKTSTESVSEESISMTSVSIRQNSAIYSYNHDIWYCQSRVPRVHKCDP